MSIALHLYRLQQIDSRLSQVTHRLAEIQAILEHNAELQAARQHLEAARLGEQEASKALKMAGYETNNLRIKLEQVESNLYSGRIQNPKELQDLQTEITALKRHLGKLEDLELEAMLTTETAQATLSTAEKNLDLTQGKVISANATLQTEQASLQRESDNLNTQRQAVLPALNPTIMALYDSLRQKRSGLAVSQVIDNSCDTCGSSLTPGYAQSVRTSAQLVHCPMCGRILYSN